MSLESIDVVPAAAPGVSPAEQKPQDDSTPKLQTAAVIPGVDVSVPEPTPKQRVSEDLSSKKPKITTATTSIASLASEPTSGQEALVGLTMETNRPKDDLDMMIEEALKMGDLVSHSRLFREKKEIEGIMDYHSHWIIRTDPKYSLHLKTTSRKTNTPQQTIEAPPQTRKSRLTAPKEQNLRPSGLRLRRRAAGREHSSVCRGTMEHKGRATLISEPSRCCRKCRSIMR